MKNNFDTTVTDKIIIGRVLPHIYAFSTTAAKDALKVGDTYRPVYKRLEEWGLHYPAIKKEYEHSARLDDERIFRDFEVHKYLINEKKRTQLQPKDIDGKHYSREFFKNASQNDLDEAIAAIKLSAINNDGKYKFYTSERLPETFTYERGTLDFPLRPNQDETVRKFSAAIAKGYTNLLMYAVMRFGKSYTALCCAIEKDFNAKLVVVLSAKADVEAEWKQTVETHVKFLEFDFLNKESLDEKKSIITEKLSSGRKLVVFLTLQDLQGADIKIRHEDLFINNLDLLIIDETHFGARAAEYGKVLNNLGLNKSEIELELNDIDDEMPFNAKELKKFNPKVSLHLSGTPYRILMGDEFKEDQIIAFYQFVDIVEAQKKWDEINLTDKNNKRNNKEWDNPYYGFPQMIRFAFNPNKSSRDRMKELRERGITNAMSHLFRPNSLKKNRDNSHKEFKYSKEILELFLVIDGQKKENGLLSFLNYDKIIEGKLCRHIVCVLPFKASCDALEKLITDNKNKFLHFNEYEIINISGVDNPGQYPSTRDIKNKIKSCENEDKKTITLTVNRMLTGATVHEWDTMLYFKDTASPQEYDQSIFRLQNQYVKTYQNVDNQIVKLNMKPQTLLVDFDPDRLFQMQIQKSLFYNINVDKKGNELLEERLKKELEISPIICANTDKLVQITPTNIIDAVRNYSQNKSILDEATDIPFDAILMENDELRALISSIRPIDAKKGLEIDPAVDEGVDLDTGTDPDPESGKKDGEKKSFEENDAPHNEDDINVIEKQLAAYRLRILFYSFLTKSKVSTLKSIIASLTDSDNKRILKNVGIHGKDLILMERISSPLILNRFEWKIKNINDLGHDKTLDPIERASRAMKKFARVSESEVVMPLNVANDLVQLLPMNKISEKSVVVDLASKQGELTVALYKRFSKQFPKLINNIYSITTSPLAYELTRKIYESLDLPLKNILNFSTFDLLGSEKDKLIKQIKDLKPDVILAGPPFQKLDGGGRKDSGSGSAIYHEYFNIAKELKPSLISMVLKASWYSGGKGVGLVEFRKKFIDDKHIAIINDYPDASKYFESPVSLRGGVCTFLWNVNHNGDCHVINHINNDTYKEIRPLRSVNDDILIRYNVGVQILKKVLLFNEKTLLKGAYSRNAFDLSSNTKVVMSSSGSDKLKVYLAKGKIGYIKQNKIPNYLTTKPLISNWKVIVAKASPGFDEIPHSIISEPIVSEPSSLCTDTHLLVSVVKNKLEAENLACYMKTKFFRFMMLLSKNNHNMNKDIFRFVPHQKLNKKWTDQELYSKYKLSQQEIKFIESLIKERK